MPRPQQDAADAGLCVPPWLAHTFVVHWPGWAMPLCHALIALTSCRSCWFRRSATLIMAGAAKGLARARAHSAAGPAPQLRTCVDVASCLLYVTPVHACQASSLEVGPLGRDLTNPSALSASQCKQISGTATTSVAYCTLRWSPWASPWDPPRSPPNVLSVGPLACTVLLAVTCVNRIFDNH